MPWSKPTFDKLKKLSENLTKIAELEIQRTRQQAEHIKNIVVIKNKRIDR